MPTRYLLRSYGLNVGVVSRKVQPEADGNAAERQVGTEQQGVRAPHRHPTQVWETTSSFVIFAHGSTC